MSMFLRCLLPALLLACASAGCGRLSFDHIDPADGGPTDGGSGELRVTALRLEDGASATRTGTVALALEAMGSRPLVAWCVRADRAAAPATDDPCWRTIDTPTTTAMVSEPSFLIAPGALPGPYSVYGWVRDDANEVSALSAEGRGTVDVDRAVIDVVLEASPPVTDVVATGVDAPGIPPSGAQLTVAAGGDLFVSWRSASAGTATSDTVDIFATTDELAWAPLATDLRNEAGAGCTLPPSATGCARLAGAAPSNDYFRVRVGTTDGLGRTVFGSSPPLNVPQTTFLAGSTDTGANGHASGFTYFPVWRINTRATHTIAVDERGAVYLSDMERGILRVDPADGIPRVFLRQTGEHTGDGGPVGDATAHTVLHVVVDYDDGLLVLDRDRIRRVDLATGTIDAFIGGGSNTSNDPMPPEDVFFDQISESRAGRLMLTPKPNGDLYFQTRRDVANPIRLYEAATRVVRTIVPSGTGYGLDPDVEVGLCTITSAGVIFAEGQPDRFVATLDDGPCAERSLALLDANGVSVGPHPVLPAGFAGVAYATSRDGALYGSNSDLAHRYQPETATWMPVLGTGDEGSCADGTIATACDVYLHGLLVDGGEQTIFVDHGLVRFIDGTGRVQTMIGRSHSGDDGDRGHSARVGEVRAIGRGDAGELVFADLDAVALRSVRDDGSGDVSTIAGIGREGLFNDTDPAVSQPLNFHASGTWQDLFVVDGPSGDIIVGRGITELHRLVRSTGVFAPLVDGSTTLWHLPAADGSPGTEVDYHSTYSYPIATDGARILISKSDYRPPRRPHLKTYTLTDGTQGHVIGVDDDTVGLPADGPIDGSSHAISTASGAAWDGGGWLIVDGNRIRRIDATTISTVAMQSASIASFARRPTGGADILYTCSRGSHVVSELDLSGGPTPTPRVIDLGHPSLECTGLTMVYVATPTPRLILPVRQNGMHAIVSVTLP